MKIRYISLQIEYPLKSGFQDEVFNIKFNKNARFVCNYLSRAVRKLNLETDGTYKMINVSPNASRSCSKMFCADAVLDSDIYVTSEEIERYKRMEETTERYEFYLSLLERGYMQAATFKEGVPLESLLSLHQQFRNGGYKNEWLFKKKPIHDFGIYIYLKCYFTSFDFRLELEVHGLKTKELITKGIVIQTSPNELSYDYKFKQIVLEDDKLVVLDFLGRPRYEMDLHELSNGNFNVKYLNDDDIKDFEIDQQKIQSLVW